MVNRPPDDPNAQGPADPFYSSYQDAGGGLDQYGLSQADEAWLMANLGVGGSVGLDLLNTGGYNEKLRAQEAEQVAAMDAAVRYAQINEQAAAAAGDLREAKRWHDMQQQIEREKLAFQQKQLDTQAQMQYTGDLMKMGSNPEQMFQYDWARYGLQPPRGANPAPLPIPDAVKPLLQNPNVGTQQGNQQTPVSQNPSLAALLPGAQPSTTGTMMPTPGTGPQLQPAGPLPGFGAAGAVSAPGGASPAGLAQAASGNVGLPSYAQALNPTGREMGPFATQPILPSVQVPSKDIGPNSKGGDVIALQRALERLGYFQLPPGANYGFYGPVTTAAVARFQSDFGIRSGNPGMWDATSAKALTARVQATGNQPVGPSPFGVRLSDVNQPPQGLPQQGFGGIRPIPPVNAPGASPPPLPGQAGAPSPGQSNAAAQPGPFTAPGASVTLTPALQALLAQEGNAQSQIPIQPPTDYKFPDLGAISSQSYNRLTPTEQGQYQGYENDVAGTPKQDIVGDINRLAPQGPGLAEPTQFMAGGGMITEPTLARGMITGKQSVMGETGPERISPERAPQAPRSPSPTPKPQLKSITLNFHPSLVPTPGAAPNRG